MKAFLFVWCVVLILAACTKQANKEKAISLTAYPSVRHCIGRISFDLPEEFLQNAGDFAEFSPRGVPKDTPAIQLHIKAQNVKKAQFLTMVEHRIAELSKEKRGSGLDYLVASKTIEPDAILVQVGNVEAFYDIELHMLRGSAYLVASLKSEEDTYNVDEGILINFSAHVDASENPQNRGLGFHLGSVTVHGDFSREWYSTSFRSEKHPDLVFGVEMDTFSKDDAETLFDRMSGPSSLLNVFDVNHIVLRKRELVVAAMRAQEWLGVAKLADRKDKVFGFALETLRAKPSLTAPKIHVDFDSGEPRPDGTPQDNSINEEEAKNLWDKVIGSIRPCGVHG